MSLKLAMCQRDGFAHGNAQSYLPMVYYSTRERRMLVVARHGRVRTITSTDVGPLPMPCGVGRQDEIIPVLDDRVLSVAHGSAGRHFDCQCGPFLCLIVFSLFPLISGSLALFFSISPLPLCRAREWGLLICYLWPLCGRCSDMSLCSRL